MASSLRQRRLKHAFFEQLQTTMNNNITLATTFDDGLAGHLHPIHTLGGVSARSISSGVSIKKRFRATSENTAGALREESLERSSRKEECNSAKLRSDGAICIGGARHRRNYIETHLAQAPSFPFVHGIGLRRKKRGIFVFLLRDNSLEGETV